MLITCEKRMKIVIPNIPTILILIKNIMYLNIHPNQQKGWQIGGNNNDKRMALSQNVDKERINYYISNRYLCGL